MILGLLPAPDYVEVPAVRRVLGAAFGDPIVTLRDEDVALAEQLDVLDRIGSRLVAAGGSPQPSRFKEAARRGVGRELLLGHEIQQLAVLAERSGVRLCLLKGAAVIMGGYAMRGARSFSDIDFLVDEEKTREFRETLVASGYQVTSDLDSEHQLAPLVSPHGGTVLELHGYIPGVHLSNSPRFLRLSDIVREGLATSVPGFETVALLIPERSLLLAHCLVHGLRHHGMAPHTYPLMRMFCDLLDLDLAEADRERLMQFEMNGIDLPMLSTVSGALDILRGQRFEASGGPRHLLNHVLAGSLDPRYSDFLRLVGPLFPAPSERPVRATLRSVFSTFFFSDKQVQASTGRTHSWWSFHWERVRRLVDLSARIGRSAVAFISLVAASRKTADLRFSS